jgi:hypothetical protein
MVHAPRIFLVGFVSLALVGCAGFGGAPRPIADPAATLPRSVAGLALTARRTPDVAAYIDSLPEDATLPAVAKALGLTRADITSTAEVGDFPPGTDALATSLTIIETVFRGASPEPLLAAFIADRTGPRACPQCAVTHMTVSDKPVVLISTQGSPFALFAYATGDILYEISVNDLAGQTSDLATAALALLP